MPTIRVEMLPGRSPEIKKAIAEGLTQVMVDQASATPSSVHVIFTEIEGTDWCVAGVPLSERQQPVKKS